MELQNPNPFSVFVGPNGAGKSNIFEAIEFFSKLCVLDMQYVSELYGGKQNLLHKNSEKIFLNFHIDLETFKINATPFYNLNNNSIGAFNWTNCLLEGKDKYERRNELINSDDKVVNYEYEIFPLSLQRIFLNNSSTKRINSESSKTVLSDGSNLEKVLSRVLQNETTRSEIVEWLQVLIPEFKDIQIETSSLSGDVNYVIFEKHTNKPFPKHLISDGTKNILALLTAVYQSDEPQFLCIEEPENGLHPHVIEHLVSLFRTACKEKGHYIWLNSHSQTLVRQLTADEIIVVEKKNGATTAKQFKGENFFGMKMDDAWLTNALGGGLP